VYAEKDFDSSPVIRKQFDAAAWLLIGLDGKSSDDESITAFRKAITLCPKYPAAHLLFTDQLAHVEGQAAAAKSEYQKAFDLGSGAIKVEAEKRLEAN